MPPFTALLHTKNAGMLLGRALEMLLPCAEILIVDHSSTDATPRIAREYGARVVTVDDHVEAKLYLEEARHNWIFCLDPSESMTESLQATLFEWGALPAFDNGVLRSFSVFVREQRAEIWQNRTIPESRLIPRTWTRWNGLMPAYDPSSILLEGDLIRLNYP
ncbi:MAG: hypothetical protein WAL56_19330 [Candidatus Sulfotelmatobacter sp.]